MVPSIGVIASPSQGVSYYERDSYYAKDDPAHKEASAWAGRGSEALGLSDPVDSETFKAVLEGKVPGGQNLGKRGRDGEIHHRGGTSPFRLRSRCRSWRWWGATTASWRRTTGRWGRRSMTIKGGRSPATSILAQDFSGMMRGSAEGAVDSVLYDLSPT